MSGLNIYETSMKSRIRAVREACAVHRPGMKPFPSINSNDDDDDKKNMFLECKPWSIL